MARSPGIYFNEIDNTMYDNPKTTSGTIVCIVGYAKKGPIDEPVLITSWSDFVSVFGKPVDSYYSGLAVRNVLNAGGAVLFNRVADASASPSNCIVKNPILGSTGYARFEKNTDIIVGTNGYQQGHIYTLKVTDTKNNTKVFYIRSPKEGKLSQQNILKQLEIQNSDIRGTNGTYEAKIHTNITPGLYSFMIQGEGLNLSTDKEVFIDLAASNTGATFVNAVKAAIATGTNATCKVYVLQQEGQLDLYGNKKFYLDISGKKYQISIQLERSDTYEDLAEKIDNALKNGSLPARCFLKEEENGLALVFISKEKIVNGSISVSSLEVDEIKKEFHTTDGYIVNTDNLFISKDYYNIVPGFVYQYDFPELSAGVTGIEETTNGETLLDKGFSVDFIEETNSIVFTNNVAFGENSTIKVVEGNLGSFLFAEDNPNVSVLGSIDGQSYLNIDITRSVTDKKIYFTSAGSLDEPKLSNVDNANYGNLLDLMKNVNNASSKGFESERGKTAIDATSRDMVVFTSKEKGSETNNIVVEVYTSVSPIPDADGKYKEKHDLTVTVNGLLKETYEDISYNYNDVDNRFDTKINEAVENGGSNYITCSVQKNDYEAEDVMLPDGRYQIGKPQTEASIKKDADVNYDELNFYDYAVGTDGIPLDGGSDLFIEALKADVSKLANKDLYDFHVLITPDDITEEVQSAAVKLCENRGDAIAIIDPPIGLNTKAVIDWHNGRGYGRNTAIESNYAATYWPWCKIFDNSSGAGKYVWIMPSVIMAAKYVTVDKTVGCWYAPAGEQNGQLSASDIECYPNKLDRDNLYTDYNRINPITKFKDGNIYVYGEKTLQRTNSVLTKIHTRRMLIQIKKQCKEAIKGYIFRPNTSEYLGKISSNITSILETYRAGGGIRYYKVICDETNNPIEIAQQDIINVDIIVVPNGTIEQVNISLTLNKNENTVEG